MPFSIQYPTRTWWHRGKAYSKAELTGDAIVHILGLLIAAAMGGLLIAGTRLPLALTVGVYVGSLIIVLAISLAFNLAPVAPIKRFLARLDQAAIFLLIAGTYTPLLSPAE